MKTCIGKRFCYSNFNTFYLNQTFGYLNFGLFCLQFPIPKLTFSLKNNNYIVYYIENVISFKNHISKNELNSKLKQDPLSIGPIILFLHPFDQKPHLINESLISLQLMKDFRKRIVLNVQQYIIQRLPSPFESDCRNYEQKTQEHCFQVKYNY